MQDSTFADIDFSGFCIFEWKKKTTLEKVVIDEEELRWHFKLREST